MVVLRESRGENKQDESLRPFGTVRARMPEGREIEVETSWYQYLGDMHLRLVFDGGQRVQSASPQDLARLHLTPAQALELAGANWRRVHGAPAAQPWSGGLMQVQGDAVDFNSSYFLDRDFWRALQAQHPRAWWWPFRGVAARAHAFHRRGICSRMTTGRCFRRHRVRDAAGRPAP